MKGEYRESQQKKRNKRVLLIAIIALLFAVTAYSLAQDTAEINNVFEIVVNNTDLAPAFGTGERIENHTYYANTSPLMVFIFTHNPLPGDIDIDFYLNGTKVQDDDVRTTVNNNNRSKWFIVPKFASYNITVEGAHHYEWREYPILSGKNGTLSINQTIINNYTNISGSNLTNQTVNFYNGNASNLSSGFLPLARYNATICTNSPAQYSRWEGALVGWNCYNDQVGTGTITQLNQGNGISLSPNPITSTGTISVNTTYINQTMDKNHANESNLNWSVAGHIMDSPIIAMINPLIIYSKLFSSYISIGDDLINIHHNGTTINDFVVNTTTSSKVNNPSIPDYSELIQSYTLFTFNRNGTNVILINKTDTVFNNNVSFKESVYGVLNSSSYYRQFWQKQGTVVSGTWSWVNDASQTDYSSVTGESAGLFRNNDADLNEYKWSGVYLGAGKYNITVVYIKSNFYGIAEFLHGSTSLGTVDYSGAGSTYNTKSTISFTKTTPEIADLRFRVNGKNASATNYFIGFSRLYIEKTGEI